MKRWTPVLVVLGLILLGVAAVYLPLPAREEGYFSPIYSPDGTEIYYLARESAGWVAGPLLGLENLTPPAPVWVRRDRFSLRRIEVESGRVETLVELSISPLEGRLLKSYRHRLFSVVTTALRWTDEGALEYRLKLDLPVEPTTESFFLTGTWGRDAPTAAANWERQGEEPVHWEQGSSVHGEREAVAVRSLDFTPCAMVEYRATSGNVRVLQQAPACARAFPDGIPTGVVEGFSNRDRIERAMAIESTEEELRQQALAKGLGEGDAEMEVIRGMRERGLYPARPQLVARPLTSEEAEGLREDDQLKPLFAISEQEFQAGLFPDLEAALLTPGVPSEKNIGRYVTHRDFKTSQRLNQFLAGGGTVFYVARSGQLYEVRLEKP